MEAKAHRVHMERISVVSVIRYHVLLRARQLDRRLSYGQRSQPDTGPRHH